jgi:nucleoside-diphosphate-sugar epimerase
MNILITGTEGYIGARMAPLFMERGHEVTGLDTGFYREGCLYVDPVGMPETPRTLARDLRHLTPADFEGFDAVVHLAELSNDPLGQNRPEITSEINHQASVRIAQAAKVAGVDRFVYASSCSVYGVDSGGGDFLDETSETNPQTAYAHCKVNVERDLTSLMDGAFCVTCLRNATAYGPSPRMRFDLVLNDLAALAWTTRRIAMISDGSPWRPMVHIEDIIEAVRCTLDAPAEVVNGETFNVGSTQENYRIRELASIVGEVFPGCEVSAGPPSGDTRSYRISFEKIRTKLPGFATRWTVRKGAEELRRLFERTDLDQVDHQFRAYTRLKQIQYLLRTGQVDDRLFWNAL